MANETYPTLLYAHSGDDPNIRYLTHFEAPDPFWILKDKRKNYLVVNVLEYGRAIAAKKSNIVFTPEDLKLKGPSGYSHSVQIIALLKKLGIKTVSVPWTFPVAIVRDIEKKKINVHVLDQEPCPQRQRKTPTEIDFLKEAQSAAVKGMKCAIKTLREAHIGRGGQLRLGTKVLSSERVRRIVEKELLDIGYNACTPIIACGDQATDCHEVGHGPLYAGQSIVLDVFPRSKEHGYWGDISRTVVKGSASPELKRLYNTVKKAQLAALASVKSGVKGSTIHRAIQEYFISRGYETGRKDSIPYGFFHSTGHGIGLEIHEAPRISLADNRLKVGEVVTVEPGLYYPGLGGVRVEDTVVVTKTGFDFLATCPKTFELR